jgi:hypothetical protein
MYADAACAPSTHRACCPSPAHTCAASGRGRRPCGRAAMGAARRIPAYRGQQKRLGSARAWCWRRHRAGGESGRPPERRRRHGGEQRRTSRQRARRCRPPGKHSPVRRRLGGIRRVSWKARRGEGRYGPCFCHAGGTHTMLSKTAVPRPQPAPLPV